MPQRALRLQPLPVFFKGPIEHHFCGQAFGTIIGQFRRCAIPAAQRRGIGEERRPQLRRLLETVGR